jgi:cytochrome c-type biogenesis protein CcmH/NrfG
LKKNKLIKVKMNKFKIFSIALLASVSVSYAQDLNQAKKAIDAEQFESAKAILKSIIKAKESNGAAAFLLGNIYLKQEAVDSAKIFFQKGLAGAEGAKLNYIGLGQIDLNGGDNVAAQTKFDLASKDSRKKDVEAAVYIGRAYMSSTKPDYKNAIAVLTRAKLNNPLDAQLLLALGDAYYGDKDQNNAYVSYRDAFQADPTLIRGKMQLGVLLKGAKAYTEAVRAYEDVIATNATYGPVYRELAETYYLWGNNEPSKYKEYIQKALGFYEKYMSLTDYSLISRMRHADFLIVAKDYKALEIEANKMIELDKVNPRIFRYLGYSAFENGNIDLAIKSLESFMSNPTNKIIALDYLKLGLAKIKKATSVDGKSIDPVLFATAISDVKKGVDLEVSITNDLSEVGKKLYEQKLYKEAASIYEIATLNKTGRNYLLDNFYLGNALYYDNNRKEVVKPDPIALQKADAAFGNVIEASPSTQDAYVFRARTNKLLENDEMMMKYYQSYIAVVTEKGAEEMAKPAVKTKFIECYNNIGAVYANTDKAKAIEYFNKTLTIDPANAYALESIKTLK